MPTFIPFVNSKRDCRALKKQFADAPIVRVSLQNLEDLKGDLGAAQLWVDPAMDGFHRPPRHRSPAWVGHISRFEHYQRFDDPAFLARPDKGVVQAFATQLLNKTVASHPAWISVPQLPARDVNVNRVNKLLAEASAKWRTSRGYDGSFILPVVLTNQRQYSDKRARDAMTKPAATRMRVSSASGLWVVDGDLSDQEGAGTLRERLPALIRFHEELLGYTGSGRMVVAGPYWCQNIVLWVRGCATHPAISLGSSYRYHLPAGRLKSPLTRVALAPLRRWARASRELRTWIGEAMRVLAPGDPAHGALAQLKHEWSVLTSSADAGPIQIVSFYRKWLDNLEATPPALRKLALYQMLSSAYVLGKRLPSLPRQEKSASRPEKVAQQHMLNCL